MEDAEHPDIAHTTGQTIFCVWELKTTACTKHILSTEQRMGLSSVPSRKILHWANVRFSAYAIAQPCGHATSVAFQTVKSLCDNIYDWDLECCKCAKMTFHCANGLVVLRTSEETLVLSNKRRTGKRSVGKTARKKSSFGTINKGKTHVRQRRICNKNDFPHFTPTLHKLTRVRYPSFCDNFREENTKTPHIWFDCELPVHGRFGSSPLDREFRAFTQSVSTSLPDSIRSAARSAFALVCVTVSVINELVISILDKRTVESDGLLTFAISQNSKPWDWHYNFIHWQLSRGVYSCEATINTTISATLITSIENHSIYFFQGEANVFQLRQRAYLVAHCTRRRRSDEPGRSQRSCTPGFCQPRYWRLSHRGGCSSCVQCTPFPLQSAQNFIIFSNVTKQIRWAA